MVADDSNGRSDDDRMLWQLKTAGEFPKKNFFWRSKKIQQNFGYWRYLLGVRMGGWLSFRESQCIFWIFKILNFLAIFSLLSKHASPMILLTDAVTIGLLESQLPDLL